MKKDFHYYAILALCRACGFQKEYALQAAYASQFVDDAKINLIYFDEKDLEQNEVVFHDIIENKPAFFNMSTCHSYYRFDTYNYEAMIKNTTAFHFVPGCEGDSFTKRLRCKKESPVIQEIVEGACEDGDPIKFGLALHAYADSYAHQGFSGILSKVNNIRKCRVYNIKPRDKFRYGRFVLRQYFQDKFINSVGFKIPAYGHVQASDFPDIPYMEWSYEYDCSGEFNGISLKVSPQNNKERYGQAFISIESYIKSFLAKNTSFADPGFGFGNLEIHRNRLLNLVTSEKSDEQRIEDWKHFLTSPTTGFFNQDDRIGYHENRWYEEAFVTFDRNLLSDRVVSGARLRENFEKSDWYRFYLAVRWYKKKFFDSCSKHHLPIPD